MWIEDSSLVVDNVASAKTRLLTASYDNRLLAPEARVGIVAIAPIELEIPCDAEKECGEDDGVALSTFETIVNVDDVDANDNKWLMLGRGMLAAFESAAVASWMRLPGERALQQE